MTRISLVLAALGIFSWTGCSKQPDPAAFVQRYVDLHRAGNVAGLLAIHTPDSEFLLPDREEPIRGKSALRDLFEYDAVLGSELVMTGVRTHGDTIFIDSVSEQNRFFRALGIDEVRYKPGTKFVLKNGLIAGTYPAPMDDETRERVGERVQTLLRWIKENRPRVLEQLQPGGMARYDAKAARILLETVKDWKTAQSPE